MNLTSVFRASFMAGFLAAASNGDTVWTVSGPGWNGDIVKLEDTSITITATFPSGDKPMYFERRNVRSIEFNLVRFNSAQPADLGAQPVKRDSKVPPPPPAADDLIVKKFGEEKHCRVQAIDASSVRCGSEILPRGTVVRIIFGAR
jgi:hypothetical protein